MFGLKKRTLQKIALGTGLLGLALGVFISSGKSLGSFIGGLASRVTNNYKITLDSSNKVTSAGDKVQHTALGNNVTFTYSGVASSTSGHVTLNANGTMVNKDHIRSITSFTAVFNAADALSFKLSYDNATWGGETTMESGRTYNVDSNPYHLFIKATSSVTITSLVINYSCVENPNAYEGQDTGDGLLGVIDFWDSSNSSDTQTSTLVNAAYVQERTYDNDTSEKENIEFVTSVSASYSYQKRYGGIGLSSGNNAASLAISLATGFEPSSVKVIAATRQSNSRTLTLNSSGKTVSANSAGITALTDTYTDELIWDFTNNEPTTLTFTATKDSKLAIYRIYLYGESGPTIEPPEESIIGFTASDSKASSYYSDDVYDTNNGLVVKAQKTGGTEVTLSKGGDDGYSYVVYNSADQIVNTASQFGNEGIYTVVVSYKNFIPVEIQLTVGFRVTLIGIEVISTNTIFNTAQKLSDYTSGITVNLTYNKESENEQNVPYSSFASKGLSLTLLDPSQVNYNITSLFGTAGTWKIKVASTSDATVFGTLDITINAIPVTGISVTGESATVEEESQLQLTASVTPNNATVQTVTWASNHESIATVNTNGLVTGVSAGEARITATATDGSAVYGYIDITVTAKPQQTEFDADMTAGSNSMSCTVDGEAGVKVGTSKAAGSMTITVGEGATRLSFYAAGWNGTSTVINLTGATCGTSSFSLTADSGISGSGSAYTLSGTESDYYFETTLSGITSETDITVSASTRFALWKAKYYTTAVEPVYPTSISLEVGSSSVAIGGTTSVEVSYSPVDTNVKNVTFSSNATSVATVSSEGIITGVAAGNARITASAEAANSGSVSAYVDITVTAIAVTGVTVSPTEKSLSVGGTQQLTATISPSNATNKNVTWTSDATSVATVSSGGLVTAVAAGTATITVKSAADNTKKATCTITVTASGGGSSGEETTTYEFTSKSWAATPANWTSGKDGYGYSNSGVQVTAGYSGANGTSPKSFDAVQSVVVTYCTNGSSGAGNIIVSVGGTQISSQSVTKSGGTSGRDLTFTSNGSLSGKVKIEVECTTNSIYVIACSITSGAAEPTDPTSISISPSSVELAPGGTKDLAVNYTPSNANQNKEITWSRYSGSSNITVSSSGVVSVSSNATAGNTAVIRAKLTNITSIYADCTVTVVEQSQDDQTILIYLCGSDLESNGQTSSSSAAGYASGDITEILKVSGQPDDVNVVIETGGAKCWKTTHGINKSYLERYHVANKSLVRDSQETKANMGLTSTLQSFLTWGVQTYPADRISLILWNHGGAMRGVCYDENYSSDSLTNSEVKTAVANTFTSLGRSTSDKFEWIGYDACLMQVQDIAEFNSQYFNYMIASEESEAGAGWDYDNWIDDAYAKKTTPNILKAICDSFLAEQGSSSDQTLSYLDLSYMSAYKSAWETMSSTINSMISSYGKSKFQTLMKTCQYYGTDSDSEGYSYFGIFDAKDVVNKIRATSAFSGASTQTNAVLTAFTNLVAYSRAGTKAGNSYGLCCFFPMKDGSGYTCNTSSVYTASQTNFTNWRSIVTSYGD